MAERFHVNRELGLGPVTITGPEAHHLAAVCRLRPGDAVRLFNGDGREYPGRITDVSKRDVTVEVLSIDAPRRELPFALHIASALPKGDRASVLVEKLTELGVTRFTILSTQRSVVVPRDAKVEKLQRQVIEASKQCGRNVLMEVESPRSWADFIRDSALPHRRLIAHPGGGTILPIREDIVAAIGPEGGFTEEEVRLATDAGWGTVGLGPRILRVETAALALAVRLSATE